MDTRQFTARTLLKVSTEWGMPDTVVPTVGRLREVLDEWFAGPTPEEAATLDQVTSSARDDKRLGSTLDGLVSLLTLVPYTSAKWAAISPVVSPFANSDSTMASRSDKRRWRLFTNWGSNVPFRSRGT